jgi:hypothetical protein
MKKMNQRVFVLSILEASEAFAAYLNSKTGEQFGEVAGCTIGINSKQGLVIWTVVSNEEAKQPVPNVVMPDGPVGSGSGTLN